MKWVLETLAGFIAHGDDRSHDDTGATATEYALLVAFIALIIVAGVGFFGAQLNVVYTALADGVASVL